MNSDLQPVMHQKGACGVTSNVDPDQSGRLIWVYTVCLSQVIVIYRSKFKKKFNQNFVSRSIIYKMFIRITDSEDPD